MSLFHLLHLCLSPIKVSHYQPEGAWSHKLRGVRLRLPDVYSLGRIGQNEERTEREVERFQERERDKGERENGEGKRTKARGKVLPE